MKVCVISSTVFPCPPVGYAGLEMIAWQIAKGLAQKGHQVSLVAPQGSSCPGVNIISTGPPGGWDERKAYQSYWQELPKFDVINDHSWTKHSLLLKAEGKLKAPVLGVLHAPVDTMYKTLPPVDKPSFVCISDDQRLHFEALFGRPARTARNGIDAGFYSSMNVPRTNRYLFLARFSTIKGPDLAIVACKEAGVGLDLVGDTSITNEPEYLEKCKGMCDGKAITMVGPASRGECVRWFSQAYCLLHPNKLFREPLGLAPLESQAACCPVIAWRYGAMTETVLHGETGFLVNSLNEMTELIRSDAIRSIDRNRCRQWVLDNFTEQKMVDRYDELIHEAVDTGGW